VGKFVDINRPTLNQAMDLQLQQGLGSRASGGGGR